jgi:hypothetical protein
MGRGTPTEMVDAYLHHLDVADDASAMEDL